MSERTFRRQIGRYEAEWLEGLIDQRRAQVSHRRAPLDQVIRAVELHRRDCPG